MKEPTRSGSEEVCRSLEAEGVEVLFGHPGGAILPLYDALHGHRSLRHVLVRHEQAAAHAADGYARVTGRTGVCLATSGPGATNLVTGLATATMDSVPLVAITGQVPTTVMGSGAFQETDILGITIPVTKHGFLVQSSADIPRVIREAFRIASSGRPGPVVVDLPKDIQLGTHATAEDIDGGNEGEPPPWALRAGAGEAIAEVARLLREAHRPVFMVGRGVALSGTAGLLREMAERHRIPVVTTLLGLDAFSRSHPMSLGLPGMHGTVRANRAIQEADLVVGLGLRFDDRVTGPVASFAPEARIALFEVEPAAVGRTVEPHVAVIGDLRETLPALASRFSGTVPEAWWGRLLKWPRETPGLRPGTPPQAPSHATSIASAEERPPRGQHPPTGRETARALARLIDATGAQVATDVGQHQMWMAQELREGEPGTHLTSGGLGTMGYALPAAMGAALGRPDRPTWVVAGDGGFQMTLQELATVVQEGIPIRTAVVNNGYLGMVRQWQELFFEGRYSASQLSGPDIAALSRAYGIPALTVSRRDELAGALRWADQSSGPVVLDIRVAKEENVYPMVPPGAAIHELVEDPGLGAPDAGGSRRPVDR